MLRYLILILSVLMVCSLVCPSVKAQGGNSIKKQGNFEFVLAFKLCPINKKAALVDFFYTDQDLHNAYPADTIRTSYHLKNRSVAATINLGFNFYCIESFKIGLSANPYINSFFPNRSKNSRVYGVQFNLQGVYELKLANNCFIPIGVNFTRVIGGYAITSGGPKNKDYLMVSGNKLYDPDIGFHIIDNSWGLGLLSGFQYTVSDKISVFTHIGYQYTFARKASMNFAGLLENEEVQWNKKTFDDGDLSLMVNHQKVTNQNIASLPYSFNGFVFEAGFSTLLKK